MALDPPSSQPPATKPRPSRGFVIFAVILSALTAGLAWAGWASRDPAHTLLGIFALGGFIGLMVTWVCASTLYAHSRLEEWVAMSLFGYVAVLAAVLFFNGPSLAAVFLPPVCAPIIGLGVFRYGYGRR